jgi:hypothetical protein
VNTKEAKLLWYVFVIGKARKAAPVYWGSLLLVMLFVSAFYYFLYFERIVIFSDLNKAKRNGQKRKVV